MSRLIFLTGTPASVAEGSGTWVGITVLKAALEALGHEVTLVRPRRGAKGAVLSRLAFNLELYERLQEMKADAVVGFDLDGFLTGGDGPLHVAAIKGVLADEAAHENGASRVALGAQALLEGWHVRHADRVVTSSVYSAERIAAFYGVHPDEIHVVPEPIDLGFWEKALREAPRVAGPSRVLSVAHLYPRKGIDTLLRAFRRLGGNATLRIVGRGPERRRLEALARELDIEERVRFLGHIPLRRLVAEYRNADVFALPTTQEGFGIVFLEAMASSLAIVAGRAAAVPEVLVDGVTALLVPPDDDEALSEGLETLLSKPAKRRAMGARGRAHVQRFDAPVVAREFLSAIGLHPISSPSAREAAR